MSGHAEPNGEIPDDIQTQRQSLQLITSPGNHGFAAERKGLFQGHRHRAPDFGKPTIERDKGAHLLQRFPSIGVNAQLGAGSETLDHDAGPDARSIGGALVSTALWSVGNHSA